MKSRNSILLRPSLVTRCAIKLLLTMSEKEQQRLAARRRQGQVEAGCLGRINRNEEALEKQRKGECEDL